MYKRQVEAGGVGMGIHVPLSVLDRLPGIGREVTVYTYFQVREDAMSLYLSLIHICSFSGQKRCEPPLIGRTVRQ